jgi:hypothetical protein
MLQKNPNQVQGAFSPPAMTQMSSFFPQNMPTNPLGGSPPPSEGAPAATQPVPGSPGAPGVEQFPPEGQPQQQQPAAQPPPQQNGGLEVPGMGNLQPWQIDQMIATGTLPPAVESTMANLLNEDPNRVNNPWMNQYYRWTSRG